MAPRYTCVLFDLDDTLLDFPSAERYALEKAAGDFGLALRDGDVGLYREINKEFWAKLEQGLIERSELAVGRFARFFEVCGLRADPAAFNGAFTRALSGHSRPLPGAAEIVSLLSGRGIFLYAVTNGLSVSARGRFAKSGFAPFFSGIFVSQDVGASKPSPRYFDFVFKNIAEKDRGKILIVGDSPSSDIAGGRGAGIAACFFDPGGTRPCVPEPDYRIRTLGELEKIVF